MAVFFSGGLNYQTVHHLFPTVGQYHYLEIMSILMKVGEKRGWRFHVKKNYTFLLWPVVLFTHLRTIGQKGGTVPLKLEY